MYSKILAYLSFSRLSFLKMLAYRARYYTGIITYLLFVSVHFFIWNAVFISAKSETINGYSLAEMITYVVIAWVARSLYFSDIDYDIDELVRSGQISIFLLRPVDFQALMTFQAAGECIFRAVFFTFPIAIVMFLIFGITPPPSFSAGMLFAIFSIGSFFILVEINFIVGILAFYFKSIQGIVRAKYYLLQLCSGLLLPFAFFPEWAQQILELLPFKAVAFLPLQFYLGKIGAESVIQEFGFLATWIVVLFIVGRMCWQNAVKKLTLQGG